MEENCMHFILGVQVPHLDCITTNVLDVGKSSFKVSSGQTVKTSYNDTDIS